MRLLTILGSKGGVGKSTLASNLLVAAGLQGLDVVGMDLDNQGSLAAWAAKRHATGTEPVVRTIAEHLTGWRRALPAGKAELVIADTPPGLLDDDHRAASRELALASQLVLIPALAEGPTLEMLGAVGGSLMTWGRRSSSYSTRSIPGAERQRLHAGISRHFARCVRKRFRLESTSTRPCTAGLQWLMTVGWVLTSRC
jgi:CobQ/CobB/MinD/ParA family nucleotide binding protein